jgi:A/G-specific adenine glycosylase
MSNHFSKSVQSIYRTKQNNIVEFQNKILIWFDENGRRFQWRLPALSTYEIVISEVLLQRTKAETVSKFYDQFLIKFPNWKSLASANLNDIELFLKPLGLYRQRAKRLQGLALFLEHNNQYLPSERELLEEIPLMGQYIANAVELLVFKKNKPLLDVNMVRVLERYFGPRKLKDIRYDPYLQALAHEVINHPKSKEINWAILDFAALVCKARSPNCSVCIFKDTCLYYLSIVNIKNII